MNDYKIRTMHRKDLDIAIEWAATEGWNPGLHDAECFYAADPDGFFIGILDDEPVAVISAVRYGRSFGFLGLYIVKPEHRRKGYGIQIWNAALDYLSGRNIGLDGVVEQQGNYAKSGFKYAYRNIRYEGLSGGLYAQSDSIIPLSQVPFEILEKYDRKFFPEQRTHFLKTWINQPGSIAIGILNGGELSGVGVIRTCRKGFKIGPLFAETPELAEILLVSLKASVKPGEPVFLDVPEINPHALVLAENQGMKVVFETARMFMDGIPEFPKEQYFGVTTFELG